jgi:transposase
MMDVMHERCAGLDVHKATVVACVRLMTGGKVNRECRTFDTTTAGLLALLAWLTESGCTHVAMEATGVYWKPVWNILGDGPFELMVANAAHIKNVPGRKTDVNDATWIADLVACGLIKASFVPGEAIQELRSLLRARKQLTREQTRHIQRIQKTLEEANIKLDSVISDILGLTGRRMIEAMIAGVRNPSKLAALADRRIRLRRRNCTTPCTAGSPIIIVSCLGCIWSSTMPWTRRPWRSIGRSRRRSHAWMRSRRPAKRRFDP